MGGCTSTRHCVGLGGRLQFLQPSVRLASVWAVGQRATATHVGARRPPPSSTPFRLAPLSLHPHCLMPHILHSMLSPSYHCCARAHTHPAPETVVRLLVAGQDTCFHSPLQRLCQLCARWSGCAHLGTSVTPSPQPRSSLTTELEHVALAIQHSWTPGSHFLWYHRCGSSAGTVPSGDLCGQWSLHRVSAWALRRGCWRCSMCIVSSIHPILEAGLHLSGRLCRLRLWL